MNSIMPFTADMEAATTNRVLPMIKNDLGIGFLPESFALDAINKKEVYKINLKEKSPERNINLLSDMNRSHSLAGKTLVKMLNEYT